MGTTARRLAGFQLQAPLGGVVAYIDEGAGRLVGVTGDQAAEEAAGLPRWLVRQVGHVEAIGRVLHDCCADCRPRLLQVAERQLELWHPPGQG